MKIELVFAVLISLAVSEPPVGYKNGQQGGQSSQYGPPGYKAGEPLSTFGRSGQQQSACPPNDPSANKELGIRAYQAIIGDHQTTNLEQYFATDYIQHNPNVGDGLESLKEFVTGLTKSEPTSKINFQRVAADGDLVWLHIRLPIFGKIMAAVDIFRIECGKIKEHWAVLQDTALERPSRNPHPFF